MIFPRSLLLAMPLVSAKLLVDFTGSDKISSLGSCQLEGQNLGDTIKCDQTTGKGNSSIYILPDAKDPSGKASLHYHRDAHFRRAEVKAAGDYSENSHYYAGFTFMLTRSRETLVLFQWKKSDGTSAPVQNIPFHLEFQDGNKLGLAWTIPGGGAKNLCTLPAMEMNKKHSIALAWDTYNGTKDKSKGVLELWYDGEKKCSNSSLELWTGPTYPKFGIYRGEDDGPYNDGNQEEYVFDYYLYAAQISDSSLAEVASAGGLSS